MKRSYTPAERHQAVGMATTVGPKRAAQQLDIPHRTISSWLHRQDSAPVIALAEADIADQLRAAHREALAAVLAGIRDPKARLLDKSRALEVLGHQLALAENRATANVATLNVDGTRTQITQHLSDAERIALRDWIDQQQAQGALAAVLADPAGVDKATILDAIGAIESMIGQGDG